MRSSLPGEDSRFGFPPAGAPTFASSHPRIRQIGIFPLIIAPALAHPCGVGHRSRLTCSPSSARAEFLQRVRRLLTGGALRPVCALGGNRLASSFQDTSADSSEEKETPLSAKQIRRLAERPPHLFYLVKSKNSASVKPAKASGAMATFSPTLPPETQIVS